MEVGLLTADDRRIVGVGQYLNAAPSGDLGGTTGVVVVEMREDKPIDVRGFQVQIG
ncbi:MAG TPA: hypothetical protein VE645_14440 [Pseudonocardiaceae bacterium]|nr:hypothetical protein [Pseudonocardiaceae bacterium]